MKNKTIEEIIEEKCSRVGDGSDDVCFSREEWNEFISQILKVSLKLRSDLCHMDGRLSAAGLEIVELRDKLKRATAD